MRVSTPLLIPKCNIRYHRCLVVKTCTTATSMHRLHVIHQHFLQHFRFWTFTQPPNATQTATGKIYLLSIIHKAALSNLCHMRAWFSQPAFHAAPTYWCPCRKCEPWGPPGSANQPSDTAEDQQVRASESSSQVHPFAQSAVGPDHGNFIPQRASLPLRMWNG